MLPLEATWFCGLMPLTMLQPEVHVDVSDAAAARIFLLMFLAKLPLKAIQMSLVWAVPEAVLMFVDTAEGPCC